ncbi:MAG: GNAT family N-acetyltransferase [Saprospiraceae bacterium]|nr:GNAT family N-acetyltransferase [Saprospiraceae bacterium]
MSLSSKRLIYKKCEPSDQEDYLLFVTNTEVMHYVSPQMLTPEEAIGRFERALLINRENKDFGYWLAYEKPAGRLIAYLKIVYYGNGQYEVGYLVLPEYWGQKYASELTAALVQYAKTFKVVKSLVGIVHVDNGASKRVLQKSGFEQYETGLYEGAPAAFLKLEIE